MVSTPSAPVKPGSPESDRKVPPACASQAWKSQASQPPFGLEVLVTKPFMPAFSVMALQAASKSSQVQVLVRVLVRDGDARRREGVGVDEHGAVVGHPGQAMKPCPLNEHSVTSDG